jgi:MFS family permease
MASSLLLWNMYSFLTPIRAVLDPRFNLTTPIQAGLFYLAPGAGYLAGTFFGGRWADRMVKKWKLKRGVRIPEDRLRAMIPSMGAVIPVCVILYGWSIEKKLGGIPLPVIVMFIQGKEAKAFNILKELADGVCLGFAQLCCFPALNTYCLEFDPTRSAEIIGKSLLLPLNETNMLTPFSW